MLCRGGCRSASFSPARLCPSRPGGLSAWLVWRPAGLAPATAPPTFFPCADAHSSRSKNLGCRRPPLRCGPTGAGRPSRRLKTAIEAASGGSRNSQEIRQWLRSAASPAATTASSPARSAPSTSTSRRPSSPSPRTTSGPRPPGHRQRSRVRRGLEQGGQGLGRRIPLGQARRPLLQRPGLRDPGPGREGRAQAHLVALTDPRRLAPSEAPHPLALGIMRSTSAPKPAETLGSRPVAPHNTSLRIIGLTWSTA